MRPSLPANRTTPFVAAEDEDNVFRVSVVCVWAALNAKSMNIQGEEEGYFVAVRPSPLISAYVHHPLFSLRSLQQGHYSG